MSNGFWKVIISVPVEVEITVGPDLINEDQAIGRAEQQFNVNDLRTGDIISTGEPVAVSWYED